MALLLGANLFLLTALSGLAMWGLQSIEKYDVKARIGTRSALLAEKVSGSAASIGRIVARMILLKRDRNEDRSKIGALESECLTSLQEYQRLADSARSTKQGVKMGELIQSWKSFRAQIFDRMKARR